MYGELIGKVTADHLRTHIRALLDEVDGWYPDEDKVTLTTPKLIETSSVVGGMIKEFDKVLPQYGIDIPGKAFSPDVTNLINYLYSGQINGLITATSREAADKLVHRHEAAVELFVRRHAFLHQIVTDQFTIVEMAFNGLDMSGAEDLGEVEGREVWLAAFSINVDWLISEDGAEQHG